MKSLILILIFGAVAGNLQAHDPGLSAASIDVLAERIEVTIHYAPADVKSLAGPEPEIARLQTIGRTLVALGPPTRIERAESVEFRASFPLPGVATITFHSAWLGLLPRGHRQAVTVRDRTGATTSSMLLSAQQDTAEVALPALLDRPSDNAPRITWASFISLGIWHIWTGYDHLLFLCALLLTCPRPRAALVLITCFTAAHSVTLALATFELIQLPSRWVEAVIAASIIYVAVENVVSRSALRGRALLTFGFGLIHGLGFAGALREVGVGTGFGAIASVLGFNLGVELGQIAISAIVLALFLRLRSNPIFLSRGVPICSALIAGAGAYWLVERTLETGVLAR